MSSATNAPSDSRGDSPYPTDSGANTIAIREVLSRLCHGLAQILGFAALGLSAGCVVFLAFSPLLTNTTSMRVALSFTGYGNGEYPDHSKFQPDDLRAPDVIVEALKRAGLQANEQLQGTVRAGLTIEGIITPNVVKERDRLRASGQTLSSFVPDEYTLSLTLPRNSPIGSRQRELLLNQVVVAFQDKFQRTFTEVPVSFGNAFETLHGADWFEYELIFNNEIRDITDYLQHQLDQAKMFRSMTTNFSFGDLLTQTELFAQIKLNETLGLIRQNGLSSDRKMAMLKMDYYLRILEDREQKAIQENTVVDDLLAKSQDHSQSYVLGVKSQAAQLHPESPILDQGLIDSLLANDSQNFLVHRALESGLLVKDIQAEKEQLIERRKDMEAFTKNDSGIQSTVLDEATQSLARMESAYKTLISNIRKTQADFAKQQFADAIRISMQPVTGSLLKPIALAGAAGGLIGLALGIGLSLLGVYVGNRKGGKPDSFI